MHSWPEVEVPKIDLSLEPLTVYSTKNQSLVTIPKKKKYQIYVCGITPYDATHLGHAATYLTFDILIRYWKALGADVNYIQNITDIDDPLLERASRDQIDWKDLAYSQIELFRSDMQALRVIPPTYYEGAVAAIPDVINAVIELDQHGWVYKVENDYYFEIARDMGFGSESHLNRNEMLNIFAERGGDPSRTGKRNPLDALLWLAKRPSEPSWPAPFGDGRPGWHIECAAIALKFAERDKNFETVIDIQGGGSDLIFPHHEMSASQIRALTGKELAAAYVHAGMIGLDGEKMSKSKGNLVFVSKLIESGVDPATIRWALLKRHYRSDYMWNRTETDMANEEISNLRAKLESDQIPQTEELTQKITSSIANDLDTPSAITAVNSWAASNGSGGNREELLKVLDAFLGFKF